ncbi:hypothetical protein FHG87_014692 [Trinorchestia longiramus]|nr:hypothetical protein FHG87_014692 [Trinorchestia longiramus]
MSLTTQWLRQSILSAPILPVCSPSSSPSVLHHPPRLFSIILPVCSPSSSPSVLHHPPLTAPAPPDDKALEEEREKVRVEYEQKLQELKQEKEAEAKSKQAMQLEVDEIKQQYEKELAAVAEKARLQQEEFLRQQEEQQKLLQQQTRPGKNKSIATHRGGTVDGYEEDWETDTVEDLEEKEGVTTSTKQLNKTPVTVGVLKMSTQQYQLSQEQKEALKRLREIQEKMVGGERKEDKELKAKRQKRKKYMEKRMKILTEALRDVDDEDGIMLKVYDDIHEELRVKTELAKKQKQKIKSLEAEIEDITSEFQNERSDYLETIRKLDQQAKLLQSIIDKVQPTIRRDCNYSTLDVIKKEAIWDDEYQRWKLPDLALVKTKLPPAGMTGSMTLNPDYLVNVSNSKNKSRANNSYHNGMVYSNRSPDEPDSGTGSANYSEYNSGSNSVNNSFNGGHRSDVDSLGSSLLSNGKNLLVGDGVLQKGARNPSQTAPARLGMWEDENAEDKFLKKLVKGEQEDIAGNYFKPKRATELLVRFQEEPGLARKTLKQKPPSHSLGMSLSQSMWGNQLSLSNSLGNNVGNSSWGPSSSSSGLTGGGFGGGFPNTLGQSFSSGALAGASDTYNSSSNGWFGNGNSSPESRKPMRLNALTTPGGSNIVAGRRAGHRKVSKDDLDTLHLL